NSSNGVQFGVDWLTANNAVLGVMAGYEDHRSRIAADRTEAEDYYFGLYGGRLFRNGVDVRGFFGYGSQDYNISRVASIGDLGNLPAKSNPNGDTYELNFEIGRRTYLNNRLSFRPFFGVDYSKNAIGATDESAWDEYGSIDVPTFHYGKVNLEQVFLRVGTDLRYQRGRLGWYGNFAYSANVGDDYASANVNAVANGGYDWTPLHGHTGELRSVKYGNSIFTLGTGANFDLTKNWSVNIDYNADIYTDGKAKAVHTGLVGTSVKF
ncbi:MAG: autotransporter outer membrane beta-barrel domain-containing protein, partial [Planctomycetaceae bacterium]|nr:autotransporter outer membrane beta-barrel domain-containing protein [Planctomycetaceae bacterium]